MQLPYKPIKGKLRVNADQFCATGYLLNLLGISIPDDGICSVFPSRVIFNYAGFECSVKLSNDLGEVFIINDTAQYTEAFKMLPNLLLSNKEEWSLIAGDSKYNNALSTIQSIINEWEVDLVRELTTV